MARYGKRPLVETSWKSRAGCIEVPAALFFPQVERVSHAVAEVCAGCPVREECLEYAIDNNELGIWAGTSASQRMKLRRRRDQAA
jgi:WhiB family redox-sensing transcriptional regulator